MGQFDLEAISGKGESVIEIASCDERLTNLIWVLLFFRSQSSTATAATTAVSDIWCVAVMTSRFHNNTIRIPQSCDVTSHTALLWKTQTWKHTTATLQLLLVANGMFWFRGIPFRGFPCLVFVWNDSCLFTLFVCHRARIRAEPCYYFVVVLFVRKGFAPAAPLMFPFCVTDLVH